MPASYFTIESLSLIDFRDIWLKIMKWLCFVSIVVQILHDINVLPANGLDVRGCLTTLYFFNCDWGQYRLSSIYWEPGQFQILLISTLCMFTDELANKDKLKRLIKKFGILFIALIMTLSTTGYMCLMILVISISFFSGERHGSIIPKILSLFFAAGFVILLFFSNAIQEKMEQSQNMAQRSSTSIRVMDNIALVNSIAESPWFGYGIDSKNQTISLEENGSFSASNGWLYAASGYGIVYVAIILVCMYNRINKMPKSIPSFFIWITLFLSQCNEYIIFFPYIYIYLFNFKNKILI
jgi:hypothetical protein